MWVYNLKAVITEFEQIIISRAVDEGPAQDVFWTELMQAPYFTMAPEQTESDIGRIKNDIGFAFCMKFILDLDYVASGNTNDGRLPGDVVTSRASVTESPSSRHYPMDSRGPDRFRQVRYDRFGEELRKHVESLYKATKLGDGEPFLRDGQPISREVLIKAEKKLEIVGHRNRSLIGGSVGSGQSRG